MPYKVYHGKTGVIYNVTKSAVGVIIYRKVGNRYIEKRVNVRVEHITSSRSREECKYLRLMMPRISTKQHRFLPDSLRPGIRIHQPLSLLEYFSSEATVTDRLCLCI
jgi:hypothetical protein